MIFLLIPEAFFSRKAFIGLIGGSDLLERGVYIRTITVLYYPTALRRVQITPKTSTNITRYLYSRGPV